MNIVTVTFYCSVPGIVLATVSDEVHCVDGKRTATLGAIKGDEPSLTAAATTSQVDGALENNTESGAVLVLGENAILKISKPIRCRQEDREGQTFKSLSN